MLGEFLVVDPRWKAVIDVSLAEAGGSWSTADRALAESKVSWITLFAGRKNAKFESGEHSTIWSTDGTIIAKFVLELHRIWNRIREGQLLQLYLKLFAKVDFANLFIA
mgnify:FL=1